MGVLAKNLKKAREELGISQAELGRRAGGMTQQAIGAIESGDVDRPTKIRELARALRTTPEKLLGEKPDLTYVPDDGETPRGKRESPPPKGDIPNLTIHAGMGAGGLLAVEGAELGFVPDNYTNGYWTFPAPIRSRFQHMSKTHALPVVGDSMEPTLIDGSIVFVDTTHIVPSPPDLYAVDYGDGLMVKRIELVPKSRKVRVISDNDSRYDTYTLNRDDLRVFGRVVAWFQWRG